jgi:hypothetical protein
MEDKCDMRDQTSDKVLIFMKENPEKKNGYSLILLNEDGKLTKKLCEKTTYEEMLKIFSFENYEFISFKFIPFGYNKDLDNDVFNNLTGLEKICI